MENIPTQEEQVKRPSWRKIPGFRSGKAWKMVLASMFYVFWLLVFIGAATGDRTNQQAKDKPKTEQTQKTTAPEQTQAQQASVQQPQASQPKIPGTLGFTPSEFKNRFNQAATEFKTELRISNLKVEPGSVQDTFQCQFTNSLGLVGSVNKADGSVRDIMIIGQGDGTAKSGMDIIMSMGILIAAANPELSANERGNILRDLGLLGDNVNLKNLDKKTVRNGRKYHINTSDVIGIMFSVGDANDKG